MTRNRQDSDNGPRRRLSPQQYSELNATFYEAEPHSYLRARLQNLVSSFRPASTDTTAEGSIISIGALRVDGGNVADADTLRRFAAMESEVLLHHAGETLLRLYLAHRGRPACPWLEVSKLRDFRKFKDEARKLMEQRAPDTSFCEVFLGGTTAATAGVELSEDDWNSALRAVKTLVTNIARILLDDSDLYNATKHGLVGLPTETGSLTLNDVPLADGPALLHLTSHRQDTGQKWRVRSAFVDYDTNLILILQCCYAIFSLWSVARRQYAGSPGELILLDEDETLVSPFLGAVSTPRIATAITYDLPEEERLRDGSWKLAGTTINIEALRLSDEALEAYDRVNGTPLSARTVPLPLRPGDERLPSGAPGHLFPFSPRDSQSVRADGEAT